jgi:hypothetical protein
MLHLGFSQLVKLAPVIFAIHNAEEAPQMERWTHNLPASLHPTVTTREFTLAVTFLTIVVTAIAVWTYHAPRQPLAAEILLAIQGRNPN